tara:strand:- start:20581 stop:20793 length:213 start_codon:yes stop_codon:yes gene_type:complete
MKYTEDFLLKLLQVQSNLTPMDFKEMFGDRGRNLFNLYAQNNWNLLHFFFNTVNGECRNKLLEYINNYKQ